MSAFVRDIVELQLYFYRWMLLLPVLEMKRGNEEGVMGLDRHSNNNLAMGLVTLVM